MADLARFEYLLLLHDLADRIGGKTRLQKLAFLADQLLQREFETNMGYAFYPHLIGPFCRDVYSDEKTLQAEGWTRENTEVIILPSDEAVYRTEYFITSKGRTYVRTHVAPRIPKTQYRALKEMVDRYREMPIKELLRQLYSEYPEFAKKSILTELRDS